MSARMNQSDGHQNMNQHTQQYRQEENPQKQQRDSNQGNAGDYIDFEEIKD